MKFLAQIRNPVLPKSLGGNGGTIEDGGKNVGLLIGNLIGVIFIIAFITAFFYVLIGGINWVSSGGDKEKLVTARNQITHALVGLIVVGAGWAVMTLVSQFLGLDFPVMTIPSIQMSP